MNCGTEELRASEFDLICTKINLIAARKKDSVTFNCFLI